MSWSLEIGIQNRCDRVSRNRGRLKIRYCRSYDGDSNQSETTRLAAGLNWCLSPKHSLIAKRHYSHCSGAVLEVFSMGGVFASLSERGLFHEGMHHIRLCTAALATHCFVWVPPRLCPLGLLWAHGVPAWLQLRSYPLVIKVVCECLSTAIILAELFCRRAYKERSSWRRDDSYERWVPFFFDYLSLSHFGQTASRQISLFLKASEWSSDHGKRDIRRGTSSTRWSRGIGRSYQSTATSGRKVCRGERGNGATPTKTNSSCFLVETSQSRGTLSSTRWKRWKKGQKGTRRWFLALLALLLWVRNFTPRMRLCLPSRCSSSLSRGSRAPKKSTKTADGGGRTD